MSQPSNENELMLYRVLQRANLVQYFDMFTAQGGDDVYQLCEAGEEEFLEIMALVGMASKPLHVRRLQKALHEWLTNPELFNSSEDVIHPFVSTPAKGSILSSVPRSANLASTYYWMRSGQNANSSLIPGIQLTGNHQNKTSSVDNGREESNSNGRHASPYVGLLDQDFLLVDHSNASSPTPSGGGQTQSEPLGLSDSQLKAIEICSAELAKNLPMYAPRPLNVKKPIDKEIEEVLNYPDDYPNRIDVLRKYSAIYGRFDSKRKFDKQMNLHEMCVNESAAQLCRYRPSLLTRREDLFAHARQVVRESGFQYSKGHSRLRDNFSVNDSTPPLKTVKLEPESNQSKNNSGPFFESTGDEDVLTGGRSYATLSPSVDHGDNSEFAVDSQSRNLIIDENAVNNSLVVDEGLRFAQQYGFGELEEQLREMKKDSLQQFESNATTEDNDNNRNGRQRNELNCDEKEKRKTTKEMKNS